MQAGRTIWRTGPNQSFSADFDGFHLVVQGPHGTEGSARFYVLQRGAGGDRRKVGWGTEPDLRAAMAAAERMAERVAGRQLARD